MAAFGLWKSWRPDNIKGAALQKAEVRMGLATVFLQGQIKRAINRGNPGGKRPSRPGEPPKKVTATLFKSIYADVKRVGDQVIGYVGSNIKYARHLEFGTSKMAARPFFRPTMIKNRDRIMQILGAKPRRTSGPSARSPHSTSRFT